MMTAVRLVPVPPPSKSPFDEKANSLGLVRGLRAQKSRDQYRCFACSQMQKPDSWLVWVPDAVRLGDPAWSVSEFARQSAFNGTSSGWCLKCAQTLGRK